MKRWLRFTAAVLAAAFLFALTGCGSSTNSASFTWFVDSIPANLDPQVASGASDVIACENLYGTLVRKDPDGELVPGLCEKWTVSPDGLTYTFTLKDGLTYAAAKGAATEYDITAEDFVFAFRRIFRADTASPYAVEFSAIQNSAAVQAGLADESSLGVSANGPLTLVFRLSERDDNFLAKLALPGAAPCDEAFFESTRGTYGLTAKTTLASGSFYLYNWTANGLFLRRTVESPLVGSLRLVQDTSGSGKSASGSGFGTVGYLIFMVLLFAVMYFILIRPQKKKDKEAKAMQSSLQVGDEIVTIGGIVGLVVQVNEDNIVIETTGNRNKIRLKNWAVQENLTMTENAKRKQEAQIAAAKEKRAGKKKKKDSDDSDQGMLKD